MTNLRATREALIEVIAENLRWSTNPNSRKHDFKKATELADTLIELVKAGIHGRKR